MVGSSLDDGGSAWRDSTAGGTCRATTPMRGRKRPRGREGAERISDAAPFRSAFGSDSRKLGDLPLGGPAQRLDVDLLHLHHCGHDPVESRRVFVLDELEEDAWHDLPGQAELVLEPAALHLLAP